MKNYSRNIMILTGLIIIFLLVFFKFRIPEKDQRFVARINNEKISYSEFLEFLTDFGELTTNEKRDALDLMINQKLIVLYAEKSGAIDDTLAEKFKKERKYSYMFEIADEFLAEQVKSKVKITKGEIEKYYKEKDFYNLYYLGVPTTADSAYEKIKDIQYLAESGVKYENIIAAEFDKPVDEYYLGIFELDDLKGEFSIFADYCRDLNIGEYSDIFKTNFGYIILYRSEKPELKDAKLNLKGSLMVKKEDKIKNDYLDAVTADVIVNQDALEKNGNGLDENADTEWIVKFENSDSLISLSDFKEMTEYFYYVDDLSEKSVEILESYAEELGVIKSLAMQAELAEFENDFNFKKRWNKKRIELERKFGEETVKYVLDEKEKDFAITERMAQDYYLGHKNEFRESDMIKFQKIIVENEADAADVFNRAKNGEDFDELVQSYSLEGNAELTLGRTPYYSKKEIPDLYDKLIPFNNGEIIEPVRVDNEFWVCKIIDIQRGATRTFKQAKTDIYNRIFMNKIEDWLESVKKEYGIKVQKYYENVI